jgi:hypothetical protein
MYCTTVWVPHPRDAFVFVAKVGKHDALFLGRINSAPQQFRLPSALIRCNIRLAYQAADASPPKGVELARRRARNFAEQLIPLQSVAAKIPIGMTLPVYGAWPYRHDPDIRIQLALRALVCAAAKKHFRRGSIETEIVFVRGGWTVAANTERRPQGGRRIQTESVGMFKASEMRADSTRSQTPMWFVRYPAANIAVHRRVLRPESGGGGQGKFSTPAGKD